MGLFDSILPSLFSAGNQVKKNVRGLLADPVGQSNNLARSVSDNLQGLLGPLAGIQAETARGQGVLGSDPALQQAARDRQVAAVSNFLAPMATVWHGSPHKFSKFDASKIGTGEGAQAYGHGLYLAESPGVAESYKNALEAAPEIRNWRVGSIDLIRGGNYQNYSPRDSSSMAQARALLAEDFLINEANIALAFRAGGIPSARAKMKEVAEQRAAMAAEDNPTLKIPLSVLSKNIDTSVFDVAPSTASLYKVDLPDSAIAKMLDWDKPLSQQPQEIMSIVQQKLKEQKYLGPNDNGPRQLKAALKAWKMEHGGMSETAMESLVGGRGNLLGATPEEVAQNLNNIGIPGIRYLDGGSRGAGTGTSNYVVFPGNEGLLTILERNGKPLLGD
jgi:hypothetical protein